MEQASKKIGAPLGLTKSMHSVGSVANGIFVLKKGPVG